MIVNRRQFLRRSICAALGGAGLYSALGNLKLISAAAAASPRYAFDDYKALVCIYLYGGNDSFNTVVPYDTAHYGVYATTRSGLALPMTDIAANALSVLADGAPSDGGAYGLNPAMGTSPSLPDGEVANPGLRALFNNGNAAIVANVGSLIYPMTQAGYQNGSIPTPPQLYSHDDQTTQWQTSRPDDTNANGWGGRIADMLASANSGNLPMSITMAGQNLFQRGDVVNQYAVDSNQASDAAAGALDGGGNPIFFNVSGMSYRGDGPEWWVASDAGGRAAYDALRASGTQNHVLERAFADSANRAIDNAATLNAALNGVTLATPFPDTDLGNQLAAVAMMIKVRASLGMHRQVFFVAANNYDTHTSQIGDQHDNLSQLSQALNAFYSATAEPGMDVADSVTAFTASDFGRSLAVNADGTDHGWGGHHFVIGGAVRGQRFYGAVPSLAQYDDSDPQGSNPDDTGYGQIIPRIAVDQYAATLASWFGVSNAGIADIFPNLGRFGTANLGFMG